MANKFTKKYDPFAQVNRVKRRRRVPQPIAGVLTSALKRYGLEDGLARYEFTRDWSQIVGEEIGRRTRPDYIRKGTLVVRVCDSVWAQELSFQRDVILARLNRYLAGKMTLNDLVFSVGL